MCKDRVGKEDDDAWGRGAYGWELGFHGLVSTYRRILFNWTGPFDHDTEQ